MKSLIAATRSVMLNEGISSFKYKVPKDKEAQLFDFYVLISLPLWNLEGSHDKVQHRDFTELRVAAEEAQERIVNHLKEQMLKDVLFSITAEFRHVLALNHAEDLITFARRNNSEKELKMYIKAFTLRGHGYQSMDDQLRKIRTEFDENDRRGYLDSYKSVLQAWKGNIPSFVKFAQNAFTQLKWNGGYGGEAWGNIASTWLKLYNVNNYKDKTVWIDRIFDLQHNTDTVFNKIKAYAKHGGYTWLGKALDKKRNIRHLFQLINDISPSVKTFTARLVKAATGDTLESWSKKTAISAEPTQTKIKRDRLPDLTQIELDDHSKVKNDGGVWKSGTWNGGIWKLGTWEDGTWKNGTWENGTWHDGLWKNGLWKTGLWKNGLWEKGTWKNGTWERGFWVGGMWEYGTWENGTWKDGAWEKGTWQDGLWKNGLWETGLWKNGTWKKGTWKNGTWQDGTWEYGTWEKGIWEKGTWQDGLWENGTWKKGTWQDGTWKNGTWHDGFWLNGFWKNGNWEKGTWRAGRWKDGTWHDGLWENGTWQDGLWENGTWENGTWEKGIWENGTWETGFWENGTWETGTWQDGTWQDGIWQTGFWKNGTWENGTWRAGVWKSGTWYGGMWEYGTWENGTWENGTWQEGLWENGTWKNGTWQDGLWQDGIWETGLWKDGIWIKGLIYSDKQKKFVKSTVNPKEFYANEG